MIGDLDPLFGIAFIRILWLFFRQQNGKKNIANTRQAFLHRCLDVTHDTLMSDMMSAASAGGPGWESSAQFFTDL